METGWIHSLRIDRNRFKSAKPFSHIIIPHFLKKEKLHKKESDLFQFSQTRDLSHSPNMAPFVQFLYSPQFINLMIEMTGFSLKSRPIDIHATLYQDTDYVLCHDDKLEGRKIAYLLYLTDVASGNLELLGSKNGMPTNVLKRIRPKKNLFVAFEVSKKSFHQVSEVEGNDQRLAIGGWFYD